MEAHPAGALKNCPEKIMILRRILFILATAVLGGAAIYAWADCPAVCPSAAATSLNAGATCYYIDSVAGNNNTGTGSIAAPWKGITKINSQTGFTGSDEICLKRGSTFYWHARVNGPGAISSPPSGGTFAGGTLFSTTAPFTIDAYGNGPPPTIQGEFIVGNSVTPEVGWTHLSGNIYYTTVTSPSEGTGFVPSNISSVKFGGVWGNCKGQYSLATAYCVGTTGTSALANNRDWYFSSLSYTGCSPNCGTTGNLYVYDSIGSNPSTDLGVVAIILDGYAQLLDLDGVSDVSLQHLKLLNASWYGLEYRGATADNLVVANVYADTEVPFNYQATGFYLHPTSPASNLSLLATESHRGYYGYQFCNSTTPGCVTSGGATLSNCKAYFNRDAGLADLSTTGTAVNYDHCHFYGNGVGSPVPNDIAIDPNTSACTGSQICTPGGVAGAGNIAPNTDPHVVSWHNYTPRFTLGYRGPGYSYGSDVALNLQLPVITAAGAPLSIGIATNYSYSQALIGQFETWLAAGYDLNSMGLSAASYANAGTLTILYTGTCTTTALTINGPPATSLAVVASGGTCPGGDSFTIPTITSSTMLAGLKSLLAAYSNYTVAWVQPCGSCGWTNGSAMLAQDLKAVSGAYVGPVGGGFTAPGYVVNLNPDQFLHDETLKSQAWIEANVTGYGSTWLYLYPATLFNPYAMSQLSPPSYIEYDVANSSSTPYAGAIGATSMQLGRSGLSGAYDAVAANGVDAQGLSTYSLGGWASLTPVALQAAIQAAVEKASVWGVPQPLYWQSGFISNAQLALVIKDLQALGVTLMTNSALVNFLGGKAALGVPVQSGSGGCACWGWAPDGSANINFTPTYLSPTVGAGANLGTSYSVDLNGVPQPQTWSATNAATSAVVSKSGWDIGSQALVPSFFGGLRPGH
jgi:hypothetical protein